MKETKPNGLQVLNPKGFIPPQATDLERSILGIIMLERDAFAITAQILKPEIFYQERHQIIYKVFQDLDFRDQVIDLLTVSQEVIRQKLVDRIGGIHELTLLTQGVVSSASLEQWSRILLQKWILRTLASTARNMLNQAYEPSTDCFELLEDFQGQVEKINMLVHGTTTESYSDMVIKRTTAHASYDGKAPTGLLTGFRSLDKIIMWLEPYLHICAARPGMGKTAFMLNLIDNITSGRNAVPVGFMELETSNEPFIDRHLARKSGLSTRTIKMGGLTEPEQHRLFFAAQEILEQPIIADFIPNMNITMIAAKARMWVKKYGIKILFIDYLQLIETTEKYERTNRDVQVGKDAQALAALAKLLKIPVYVFAQLNREVHKRAGNRPILSDIRESGSIEAAARLIYFIHLPEYYVTSGPAMDEDGNPLPKGLTEIIVAKNNEGEKGTANLIFKKEFMTYEDYDEPDQWRSVNGEMF